MNATARGEAAEYRRRGWSPIPIKDHSKQTSLVELEPYLYRAATTEELNSWAWPGVGIVTGPLSGVLVLDIDAPEGEAELKKHGHPVTPMVRTPGGGLHLYFKHPEQPVRTGIRVAPGLDVKASGGYVVAPPSIGENGKPYEWIVSPEEADLVDPPRWLMELLQRERPKGPAKPVGERIPPGKRNDALTSLAGTMRRRGMGEAEILAALLVTNEQRCAPPLEAEEVEKIAASVAGYEPVDDGARILLNRSEEAAPPPTEGRPRFERIDLGEPIESGMEPAEMLVPDVLYAGSVHGIYSAGGKGKTFFALWLVKQVIDQDLPVMLLDQENGVRIISERLRALGVSAEQARRNLHYYPFPSMPLEAAASAEFEELLDEVKPALVVLDSWINFLASAGLDENSSVDIAQWADTYSQKARQRGMAILLLDHIPKEGNTARGSGRKLDYVDVMWELTKPQHFDRETVGRIDLRLKKDREGWMPWGVAFTVGGNDGNLVFGRTAFDSSFLAPDNLLPSDRTTLDALKAFGSSGARDKDWREESIKRGLGRTTYYRSRGTLLEQGLVEEVMGKYFYKTPAKQESHLVPQESHRTSGTTAKGGKSQESHHPMGWDHGTNQAGTTHNDTEAWEGRY